MTGLKIILPALAAVIGTATAASALSPAKACRPHYESKSYRDYFGRIVRETYYINATCARSLMSRKINGQNAPIGFTRYDVLAVPAASAEP